MNLYKYLIFFFVGSSIYSQSNILHNQNKNTLIKFSEITNHFNSYDNSNNPNVLNINFYSSTFGYLLLVRSSGEYRNISSEKMKLLSGMIKSTKPDLKAEELFEKEVLIKTESENYWLPIQKSLFKYWIAELKKDDYTLIYIRTFGSTDDIPENKWFFTINSFNSNFYDGLWEEAVGSFNNQNESNGLSCLNQLIGLNPKDGRNYSMYGYYYYDKGYPNNEKLLKKADSLYTIAEKLSPKYSYGYYQKALVKFQLGEYEKAWDAIEKAKSLGETEIEDIIIKRFESKLPYTEYLKMKN